MAIKLSSLRSDIQKESDGDWIEIPNTDGLKLLVRSVYYQPFATARDAATRKLIAKYQGDSAPQEEQARINGELYATHLLLGWEGLDVPYAQETAMDILTDLGHRDMRNYVAYAAGKVGQAKAEFTDGAVKNSPAPSAGA